ncbi:MAG: bifunctional oligoribonuclease/PAP phosphatase NrnA [Bacteroidales bacterium]|nr:bifunctional oligoribonuclease/PAP phosphatase NrnA [Bacteroidales bacterium]
MITRRINESQIAKARKLIEHAEKIVTVCHTGPDGDAVGSSLAAVHVFSSLGKEIRAIVPDAPLENLRSLPGARELVDAMRYPDFARQLVEEADLILCLDFNQTSRTGRFADTLAAAKAPKILIDHHLNPDMDAEVIISHPDMAATCYLLFRFLCRLELFGFIDRNAAECLLAGMMTDTGNFAYNCSDPELFTVTAELVKKGADKEKLYNLLFNTLSANCIRLNSYALLKKMEIFPEQSAALITLSRDELNRFHYTKGDTEGLVNRPLAIPGIVYSCFMRQESDCIRVSMRSKGDFPVNKICEEHFNGGGHLNAAGGEFKGDLEEAAKAFRALLDTNKELYLHK